MLHITNGDSAAEQIRAAGVAGEILPWRDVLHDGPVPAGLSPLELDAVRARWIAEQGWGEPAAVQEAMLRRHHQLVAARGEVVLWFEHDLYDQLQLIQVLDALESREPPALINPAEYLGYATPARLAELFAVRRPATPEQTALARRAWAAFRAPDPREVQRVAEGDAAALPFLGAALRRHLEQFPHVRDGLGRSERQLLEAVDGGAATVRAAFAEHQRREDPLWLGDSTFERYARVLAGGPRPLLRIHPADEGMDAGLELTPAGRDVLAGRADRVRGSGIDRWLGGVHLRGPGAVWRWDGEKCVSA